MCGKRLTGVLAMSLLVLLASRCAGAPEVADGAAGSWRYTRTVADGVATVRTLSGSVWGGPAHLEEELSIGMPEGPDEYAFAWVTSIWATENRVVIADGRLNAVRVYDRDGTYLFGVGAVGQGPGEFVGAAAAGVLPDGRILVHDGLDLLVYDADGRYLETWRRGGGSSARIIGPGAVEITGDGAVYARVPWIPEDRRVGLSGPRWTLEPMGPEGGGAETIEPPSISYRPPTIHVVVGGTRNELPVPFAPRAHWDVLPGGGFVAGVATEYRFEVLRPDADTIIVERAAEPVPVDPDELELEKVRQQAELDGIAEIDWASMTPPAFKPAYEDLLVTRDDRILLRIPGPMTVNPECLDPGLAAEQRKIMECTSGTDSVDVFEPDGTFLGSFELPAGVDFHGSFVRGDTLWAPVEDEHGTVTVKRFRIVHPES